MYLIKPLFTALIFGTIVGTISVQVNKLQEVTSSITPDCITVVTLNCYK